MRFFTSIETTCSPLAVLQGVGLTDVGSNKGEDMKRILLGLAAASLAGACAAQTTNDNQQTATQPPATDQTQTTTTTSTSNMAAMYSAARIKEEGAIEEWQIVTLEPGKEFASTSVSSYGMSKHHYRRHRR